MKYKKVDVVFSQEIFLKKELQNLISQGFNQFQFLPSKEENKACGKTVWIIVAYKTTQGDCTHEDIDNSDHSISDMCSRLHTRYRRTDHHSGGSYMHTPDCSP